MQLHRREKPLSGCVQPSNYAGEATIDCGEKAVNQKMAIQTAKIVSSIEITCHHARRPPSTDNWARDLPFIIEVMRNRRMLALLEMNQIFI
jgi:hypothetical protein